MSSQISVGPPDLKTADPKALAVANFLRHHKLLKQREGFLNGQRQSFWRVKRAIRALQSDEYRVKQAKDSNLPAIKTKNDALEALRQFPLNRFAFNVDKLETKEAQELGQKPAPGVPVLRVSSSQDFGDDEYFVWFYEPVKLSTYLYGVGMLVVVFAVVLFPLWPIKMRIGVWYLSMGMLGLLGAFFALAIIRLIIFGVSWLASPRSFWLFPNLFEDVGFVDSFRPTYAWSDQLQTLAQQRVTDVQKQKLKKKAKKQKKLEKQKTAAAKSAAADVAGLSGRNGGLPGGPQGGPPPPGAVRVTLSPAQQKEANEKVENIKKQMTILRQNIMNSPQGPKNPEQQQQLDQSLTQQLQKQIQMEVGKIAQKALLEQQQQQAKKDSQRITPVDETNSTGTAPSSTEPVQRKVTLDEAE